MGDGFFPSLLLKLECCRVCVGATASNSLGNDPSSSESGFSRAAAGLSHQRRLVEPRPMRWRRVRD
jgi:hypothetical protein